MVRLADEKTVNGNAARDERGTKTCRAIAMSRKLLKLTLQRRRVSCAVPLQNLSNFRECDKVGREDSSYRTAHRSRSSSSRPSSSRWRPVTSRRFPVWIKSDLINTNGDEMFFSATRKNYANACDIKPFHVKFESHASRAGCAAKASRRRVLKNYVLTSKSNLIR